MRRVCLILILLYVIPCRASYKNWDEWSETERENAIVSTAYEYGHQSKYNRDCSSYISSILSKMGHDIPEFTKSYSVRGNGVRLISEYVRRAGHIVEGKIPKPGDLVFFSNTYDLNRDHKFSDPLTHIGIVTSVDRDGTVSFLHILRNQMKKGYINLYKPGTYEENGKILNSYLRRVQKNASERRLTSQLFDFFGSLAPEKL